MQMYYVYVLMKNPGGLYIGYTDDLERRLKEHNQQFESRLVYYEAYNTKILARKRERLLKYYGSAWRGLKSRISA